jgi:cysteine desulfurase
VFTKKRIYADAAAATPLSALARKELERLLNVCGNPGALHTEGVAAKKELEAARKTVADAIGAHADEIVFTGSGTEANNLAIRGVIGAVGRTEKNLHAVTTAVEHASVLEVLRALGKDGLETDVVQVDEQGLVDPKHVAESTNADTCLVTVQLVNSEIGTIEPVREIVKELRRNGDHKIYVHTDASQAPLWVDIKVERLGVDLMTLDAQKVLGPKGIGALYIRRGTPLNPLIYGGGQEQGLRSGTENVPLAGAFAMALADAQRGAGDSAASVAAVRDFLWQEIVRLIPDAVLNGPLLSGKVEPCLRVANNINVSVPGLEAQMAVISLDSLGVAASTRSACSVGADEPSHVMQAIGVPKELAGTAIRITLLPDATKSDAKRIAQALKETTERYRQ